MKKINKKTKDRIVADICRKMTRFYNDMPEGKGPISHYCMFWAKFTVESLKEAGLDAIIQAGSAYWPIITPEQDDGVCAQRFGYEFEWNEIAIANLTMGLLPEIHIWAALPKQKEIVDVTVRFWKERTIRLGYDWKATSPPDYFWGTKDNLPTYAEYRPNARAINIVLSLLKAKEGVPGYVINVADSL